jgi:salicylate hydroxylase
MLEGPTMWAMLDHLPAPRYHTGNIAMMGDAAHATTPFQGAGAGQAIEDALVLSTLFQHVRSREQIAPALAAYDTVRRPRSQKVVLTSRDALNLFCFNDGFANGDTELWGMAWDERMDWIWDIDLRKQNRRAMRIYADSIIARARL